MGEAPARGEKLRLREDDLACYDALETNKSAVQALWDETTTHNRAGASGVCQEQRDHRLGGKGKRQG